MSRLICKKGHILFLFPLLEHMFWIFVRITSITSPQGAATNSVIPPPLFQDALWCVQLLRVERNAPSHWDLAIDKAKPPMSAEELQGNDQSDLQYQTAGHCHHQVQYLILSERRLRWYGRGMLQLCSQDSLWQTGWWKAWAWEAQDDVEALSYQPS